MPASTGVSQMTTQDPPIPDRLELHYALWKVLPATLFLAAAFAWWAI